jgi:hypothetical protein
MVKGKAGFASRQLAQPVGRGAVALACEAGAVGAVRV